jgi:Flp pilus assembly protein TadD
MPKIVILEDRLTAEEHNDLGYVYENKGMYDLAEKEYLLVLKKREHWAAPLFNIGNLHFKKADYAESELYFRKALEVDPANADVMNNLANALVMQRRCREAMDMIDRALQVSRKDEYVDTRRMIVERQQHALCIE